MGVPPPLAWMLSGVFALTGVWFLVRAVGKSSSRPNRTERVCLLAHVLMSAAMIAMAWWWGMMLPAWPQVVVFAAATAWFLVLAARQRASSAGAGERRRGNGTLAHLHHAAMMACMVWMLIPMATMSMGSSGHGGMHHGSMSMSMPLMSSMSTPSPVVNVVLGLGLLVSAVAWAITAVSARTAPIGHSGQTRWPADSAGIGDAVCHGGMSVGMAAMLLMVL